RPQDIEPLARAAVARYSAKYGKGLLDIHTDALAALRAFPWPGNVRQLENAVQHAVGVSSGPALLRKTLPPPVRDRAPPPAVNANAGPHMATDESLSRNIDAVERDLIVHALEAHGNNRSRAAEALGIDRTTLYRKMRKYGLLSSPRARKPES